MRVRYEREEKREGKEDKKDIEDKKEKKPGFFAKAVLAAGLAVVAAAGCEERTINNYYCQDTGTQDAAEVQEDAAEEADVPEISDAIQDVEDINEEEIECVSDLSPPTCDSSEPIAEGILLEGEALEMDNIKFVFEGLEGYEGDASAVFTLADICDEMSITVDADLETVDTVEFMLEGATYTVEINEFNFSDVSNWVDVSIHIRCGECVADHTPTTCDYDETIAEGVVTPDISLEMGNFVLKLEDTEIHLGMTSAIYQIKDSCNNLMVRDRIQAGQIKQVMIGGAEYSIDARAVHITDGEGDTPWADFSIKISCWSDGICNVARAILNQGDTMLFDDYGLLLDDLDVSVPGEPAALVSVLDGSSATLATLRIPDDEYETFMNYRIMVLNTGTGYTFGAKWADFNITKTCSE